MKHFIIITIFAGALLASQTGRAMPCPTGFEGNGDWDGDGLSNELDPCCFVASAPGDTSGSACSGGAELDQNGNGIEAIDEGECCVVPSSGLCKGAVPELECLDVYEGAPVPCDQLLWYQHMPLEPAGEVTCSGELDCICFTLDDFDGDGSWADDPGPFDNCPDTPNEEQWNEDDDLWGDECDNCWEDFEKTVLCDPKADDCLPPAVCLPFAIFEMDGIWLHYSCSMSPDADLDHHGDDCDNCPEDLNKDQADEDDDGIGDVCDNCPFEEGLADDATDDDDDGVANECDDCPDDPHKSEEGVCGCGEKDEDKDDDGVLDCEDECPDDPDKVEPGDCGCGIPDVDKDGDGELDCKDGCPSNPDKTEPGDCGCGMADEDSDDDGTYDCKDECPDDEKKTEPGVCGCGEKDEDKDGDGRLNCNDECPGDPDKVEAGKCGCKVPETDRDDDGVPDCIDLCPEDPDKVNPGSEGCGEPDPDEDGDGIVDAEDNCLKEPNKKQEDSDEDGVGNACDNCVDEPNPKQEDEDEDGVGDACSELVYDYTGAFSCDASSRGAVERTSRSILVALAALLLG